MYWLGLAALVAAIMGTAVFLQTSRRTATSTHGLLTLARQFGDEGVGVGEFTELTGFSAGHGLIFTQERKGRVQAFDLDGHPRGAWILPTGFDFYGFVAATDGSVFKPYGSRTLRRFEGKTGRPLGEFAAAAFGLTHWRFLAPGPNATLFAADDESAVQFDPAATQILMRSEYRKQFRLTGGLISPSIRRARRILPASPSMISCASARTAR